MNLPEPTRRVSGHRNSKIELSFPFDEQGKKDAHVLAQRLKRRGYSTQLFEPGYCRDCYLVSAHSVIDHNPAHGTPDMFLSDLADICEPGSWRVNYEDALLTSNYVGPDIEKLPFYDFSDIPRPVTSHQTSVMGLSVNDAKVLAARLKRHGFKTKMNVNPGGGSASVYITVHQDDPLCDADHLKSTMSLIRSNWASAKVYAGALKEYNIDNPPQFWEEPRQSRVIPAPSTIGEPLDSGMVNLSGVGGILASNDPIETVRDKVAEKLGVDPDLIDIIDLRA
jgi:hypothetical protein